MKRLITTAILFGLCISYVYSTTIAYGPGNLHLSSSIQNSTLVVVGRVTELEYVIRDLMFAREMATTDITVDVEKIIKGKPNAGKSRVKFMIKGGKYTHPKTGKKGEARIEGAPKFNVGERIMLFLNNKISRPTDIYYENFPHGGYHLTYATHYGKRIISDDRVVFFYTIHEDPLSNNYIEVGVNFPLDLAITMGEAFVKDRPASLELEKQIEILVERRYVDARNFNVKLGIPKLLAKQLLNEAQKILDREPPNELPNNDDK